MDCLTIGQYMQPTKRHIRVMYCDAVFHQFEILDGNQKDILGILAYH